MSAAARTESESGARVFNNLRTVDLEKLTGIVSAEVAGGSGDGTGLQELDDLAQVGAAGAAAVAVRRGPVRRRLLPR